MSGALPLRHQVSRLLVAGLAATQLDATERAWLRLLRPSGIILFRRNIEDAAQVNALLAEAETAIAAGDAVMPALRAVDLEGGLVDRLREALAPMPSPAAVAGAGSSRAAARHGQLIGRAARLFGFNATFAPVLDLGLAQAQPVLRTRVAGATAQAVIAYARPFLTSLRREQVLGCGKHFPGLGGGTLDSHLATPRIQRSWDQLWAEDMLPYRELLPLLPLVMVSHGAYPRVPLAGDTPASASRFWIETTLRRRIGFAGLVLSDDLEMGGVLTRMPIEDAAVQAVAAGSDLIEICKEPSLVLRAYEALLREAERSIAFRGIVRRAAQRVTAFRESGTAPMLARAATAKQIDALCHDIRAFSNTLAANTGSTERDR